MDFREAVPGEDIRAHALAQLLAHVGHVPGAHLGHVELVARELHVFPADRPDAPVLERARRLAIEAIAALSDEEIFAMTTWVALRVAFSTVNDALGAAPDTAGLQAASPADGRGRAGRNGRHQSIRID